MRPLVLLTLASGCAFISLPTSPHLQGLTPEQVFSRAPAAEWKQPTLDDPASAAVDVVCGVGPRLRKEGTVYAAVSVRGRPPKGTVAPLNVSLVLDRSGSMHGRPFSNMVTAAEAFVSQARDGDRISVVVFSDGIFEAVPPVVLGPATRGPAVTAIRALRDGGGTNISGGLLAGLHEVFAFFAEWQVNQVVLFSDGQPTRGITDPGRLAALAARAAEHGVGVTSIGFGPVHDELLMQALADAGGGNYYYIDGPEDIAALFRQELDGLLRTAARDTVAHMMLPPGMVLEEVIGHDYFAGGGHLWVRMGAVPHGQDRYMVLRFRPESTGSGTLNIDLSYSDMARRGKFGLGCRTAFQAGGGKDAWSLELAGRAEAGWGLAEAMGWADTGSEVFVINQIGYTRGLIASMREHLGAGALTTEDRTLEGAQVALGLNVAVGATNAGLRGGLGGLLNFGTQQVVSNATTAAAASVDAAFRPFVRVAIQSAWYGQPMMFYSARTHRKYKAHGSDRSRKYKQARFDAYVKVRVR